jgi:PAS domain S-box-containing protein
MGTHPEPNPGGPEASRRDMAQALAAIVYSATPDLHLDFANWYALEYFGVVPEEIVGNRWIELVHPDDRASVLAAWEGARATGRSYRHEHRLRLEDGTYRRFLAQALPLRNERGAIVKWYGVLTPAEEKPRRRGLWPKAPKLDYYPLADPEGDLQLLEVATWEDRPEDLAAKLHPRGFWYRIEVVGGPVGPRGDEPPGAGSPGPP